MSQGPDQTIHRRLRFKLQPTPEQEVLFRQFAGVCRLVYNLALEQRATWGRKHRIAFPDQSREITQLRAEFDWIRAVHTSCTNEALRNLDSAFRNFFSGRSRYPQPRRLGVNDSFYFRGREVPTKQINERWAAVRLPKIGWIKYRNTLPIIGDVKGATINRDALGWHVSFLCERPHEAPAPHPEVVGIDRGVSTTLALSTGERLTLPVSLDRLEKQKRRAQRVVARRKRGSNRRRRAQQRVAHLLAKQARIRRHFHHQASLGIAKRFGVAALEDLKTQKMTASASGTLDNPGTGVRQKAGLNRAILNSAWRQFQSLLSYKMQERGGQVVTVSAKFTSQTCPECGVIDPKSRKSQARFVCTNCGHSNHADTNAAINIERRWSTPLLDVEGRGHAPIEASTGGVQ